MSQPSTAESLRIGGLDPHAEFAPPTDREPQLARVKLELLRPNPNQPRKHFGEPELQELMESIRQAGLIQPIAVRPSVAGSYLIVAGERRYRAFQRLAQEDRQYATIPAIIQYRSDQEVAVAALIENVVREDLNPIERAQALQDLKKALKLSWEGVAAKVGLSVRHVYFLTGMLKLRKDFREAVDAGQLTEKHARALGKLSAQPEQAWRLFEYLTAHPQLTGDDALDLVTWMRKHPGLSPDAAQDARIAALNKPDQAKPTRKAPPPAAEPATHAAVPLSTSVAPVGALQAALAVLHELNPAQLSGQDRETLRQTLFALQFKTLQLLAGVAATDQVAPVPVAPGATATAVAHPDVQWPNHLDAVTEPSSAPTGS